MGWPSHEFTSMCAIFMSVDLEKKYCFCSKRSPTDSGTHISLISTSGRFSQMYFVGPAHGYEVHPSTFICGGGELVVFGDL